MARSKPSRWPSPRPATKSGWHREGETDRFYGESLRILVHPHIDAPGTLHVSCYEIGLTKVALVATGRARARIEAVNRVESLLAVMRGDAERARQAAMRDAGERS